MTRSMWMRVLVLVAGVATGARADDPGVIRMGVGTQKLLTVGQVERLADPGGGGR